MKCSSCGAEIPDNAMFCKFCGNLVDKGSNDIINTAGASDTTGRSDTNGAADSTESTQGPIVTPPPPPPPITDVPTQRKCGFCGADLMPGVIYCPKCGHGVQEIKTSKNKSNQGLIILLSVLSGLVLAVVVGAIIVMSKSGKLNIFPDTGGGTTASTTTSTTGSVTTNNGTTNNGTTNNSAKTPTINESRLESIVSSYAPRADVAVCVIDLNSGNMYKTGNARKAMSASAMTVLPILYTADAEASSLNKGLSSISVTFRYSTTGRGTMTKVQDGDVFDMDYLIQSMLGHSDNNIINTLMDYFGMSEIRRTCSNGGYDSVDFQRHIGEKIANKDNYISAADAAGILAWLYTDGKRINKAYLERNFIINDTMRFSGMGKNLPRAQTFLNHNAYTSETYNEVCIIPDISNPYVMAFISNNGEKTSSENAAAAVSEYVYNEMR